MTTRLTRADLDAIATALDVRLADLVEQRDSDSDIAAAQQALDKVQARIRCLASRPKP